MNILYNSYRQNIKIYAIGVFLIFFIFIIKIALIQIVNAEYIKNKYGPSSIYITKVTPGQRGTIFDRQGRALVTNIRKYDFWIDARQIDDEEKIINLFSRTFNKEKNKYSKIINSGRRYLEKNVEETKARVILSELDNIKGLHQDTIYTRHYPYHDLCSQVLGFLDEKNNPISGIESYYDNVLKGDSIKTRYVRDNFGALRIFEQKRMSNSNNDKKGATDLTLTIDIDIQSIFQNELQKAVEESNAISGNGIIIEPFSGEIIAMATVPSNNLNNRNNFVVKNSRNRAISDQYEPGSTFKIIPMSAVLELGIYAPDDSIYCEEGEYDISESYGLPNKRIIYDHDPYDTLSVIEIISNSSNIGISKIVSDLPDLVLYDYSKSFGFGEFHDIGLPLESPGVFHHPSSKSWYKESKPIVSIGQGITSTSLQMAVAYSAIANDGKIMKPKIVKNTIEKDSGDLQAFESEVVRYVLTESTSTKIRNMLLEVVEDGTANNIMMNSIKIGGKTGTAQKAYNGKYSDEDFISSFASIFPIDNPQYVCIVAIDSPDKGKHWGNETAAPVVNKTVSKMVKENKIRL